MGNRSSLTALVLGAAALLVGCGAAFEPAGVSVTALGAGGAVSAGGAGRGGAAQHGGAGQGGEAGSGGDAGSPAGGAGAGGANQGGGATGGGGPECAQGYVCAPNVPAGWKGPLAYWSGVPPEQPPPCDPGWPTAEVYGVGDVSAEPASCSCSCAPSGGSCGSSVVTAWLANADCGAAGVPAPQGVSFKPGECLAVGTHDGSVRASVPPLTAPPICAGTSPVAKTSPFKWSGVGRICSGAAPGDACGQKSTCLPRLAPGAAFCIRAEGVQECSYPEFPRQVVIETQVTDTRDCVPCECGKPKNVACAGTLALYSDAACMKPVATVPADGASCGNGTFLSGKLLALPEGKCGVGTSEPIGIVSTSDPMTLCCQGGP